MRRNIHTADTTKTVTGEILIEISHARAAKLTVPLTVLAVANGRDGGSESPVK